MRRERGRYGCHRIHADMCSKCLISGPPLSGLWCWPVVERLGQPQQRIEIERRGQRRDTTAERAMRVTAIRQFL